MKILKKAFKVWHDGMLNSNPNEGYSIEELPLTYGDTPGEAKVNASEIYDFEIDGETHKYTDLKVRRAKGGDWVLYEGEKIRRNDLEYRTKEANRIDKRRKSVESFSDDSMFYIQNGYVGNAVLWWGLNSNGYVCDIHKAQAYTKQYVLKHFVNGREEDRIWESKHVLDCIKEIVDGQFLKPEFKA